MKIINYATPRNINTLTASDMLYRAYVARCLFNEKDWRVKPKTEYAKKIRNLVIGYFLSC